MRCWGVGLGWNSISRVSSMSNRSHLDVSSCQGKSITPDPKLISPSISYYWVAAIPKLRAVYFQVGSLI